MENNNTKKALTRLLKNSFNDLRLKIAEMEQQLHDFREDIYTLEETLREMGLNDITE